MQTKSRWLSIAVMTLATGCSDQTIDQAAENTKEAVDATARASKRASDASEKAMQDAKQGTHELLEKAARATDTNTPPTDTTVQPDLRPQ